MNAFILEREYILFLVGAAVCPTVEPHGTFRWFHNGHWQEMRSDDYGRAADVGNMLWRENIASVAALYPNRSSAKLPRPLRKDFVIVPADFPAFFRPIEAGELIKECNCYEYLSSKHVGWLSSEAHAFVSALRSAACRALPGYKDAASGGPDKEAV